MGNIFNDDFRELIQLLNKHAVEYLLVGGYAVILHGYRRTTGDLDIWVNRTIENFRKLHKTFLEFGLPTRDFTAYNFLHNQEIEVFTYGRPPVSIDIMMGVKGLNFNEVEKSAQLYIENHLEIKYIDYRSLIIAKERSGRHKDLDDLEKLRK